LELSTGVSRSDRLGIKLTRNLRSATGRHATDLAEDVSRFVDLGWTTQRHDAALGKGLFWGKLCKALSQERFIGTRTFKHRPFKG